MHDMKIPRCQTGYCTNVHAGPDLAGMRANLERYALAVKRSASPNEAMGIGLWFSAQAASKLRAEGQVQELRDWLAQSGLVPFTFNGFPHGDFHQDVVKHRVYHPTWAERARLDYTLDLVTIQDALLPVGMEGSISTLPIGWGSPAPTDAFLQAAADNLLHLAEHLRRLEEDRGRLISVCLEPEPGCVLQRTGDVLVFFDRYVPKWARRYLRVCHDVCHSAVMFEGQAEVLDAYEKAGIRIGKIQVSAAVRVDFDALSAERRLEAFEQLRRFDERRYLHQTLVKAPGQEPIYYEDLPDLLQQTTTPAGEWRTHFHVPIYLGAFGSLRSTQDDIRACLRAARNVRHFEVETYAWGVLPETLREPDLAAGIAREMTWFWQEMEQITS